MKLGPAILIALALPVGACSKGGSDCDSAINKGVDAMNAQRRIDMAPKAGQPPLTADAEARMKVQIELAEKTSDQIRTMLIGHCKSDEWPAETLNCFSAAARKDDFGKCMNAMPKDQQAKLVDELKKTNFGDKRLRPMHGPTGSMDPGGPAGMPMQHPSLQHSLPPGSPVAPPVPPMSPQGLPAPTPAPTPAPPAP